MSTALDRRLAALEMARGVGGTVGGVVTQRDGESADDAIERMRLAVAS